MLRNWGTRVLLSANSLFLAQGQGGKWGPVMSSYFSWMVGGPQGSGLNVSAEILAKALSRAGYYVFGQIEYHSNIKGKHSAYRLRIQDTPAGSHVETVHLLSALDEETRSEERRVGKECRSRWSP